MKDVNILSRIRQICRLARKYSEENLTKEDSINSSNPRKKLEKEILLLCT